MLQTRFFSFFLIGGLIFGLIIGGAGCTIGSSSKDDGVYKSIDGGEKWQHLASKEEGTTLLPPFEVTALVIDKLFNQTVYVGSKNKGIFKTTDGGENWQAINNDIPKEGKGTRVTGIGIDGLSSEIIYLVTFQDSYGRVYKSENSGGNWTEIYTESNKKSEINTLVVDPLSSGTLYLGTSEGGILKSVDYGNSWRALKWYEKYEITCLTIDPNNSSKIYAGTNKDLGILKSEDGGETWTETDVNDDSDKIEGTQEISSYNKKKDFFVYSVVVDPSNSDVVYAGTDHGIYYSTDGVKQWILGDTLMPPKSTAVFAIAVDPDHSDTIYFSTEKVVYRSVNKGKSWEANELQAPGQVKFLVIDPANSQTIYLGVGDSGANKSGPLF